MLEHMMEGYEQALDTGEERVSMQKPDLVKIVITPAWLWKSVVQLLASHEAGYLEHCRT